MSDTTNTSAPASGKAQQAEKPWNGRFTEPTDAFVEAFTASVTFDQRMYQQDIAGSVKDHRLTTPPPPDNATIWFVTVTDERGMIVSSELVFAPQSGGL